MVAPGPPPMLTVGNPPAFAVSPGEFVTVPVTIRMAGTPGAVAAGPMAQVTQLFVTVLGLDIDRGVPFSEVPVPAPGETVTVELAVSLPVGTPAGRIDLRVSVQPVDVHERAVGPAVFSDLLVEVGATAGLGLEIAPAQPRGNRRRRFRLVLDNRSAAPIDVGLSVEAAAGLRVRLDEQRVVVPARSHREVKGKLRARGRTLGPVRRMPFVVTAQGATTPARLNATFAQRPTLHGGPSKVLALILVLGLWLGAAFAGLSAVAKHQKTSSDTVSAAAAKSAEAAQKSADASAAAASNPAGAAGAQAAAAAAASDKAAAAVAAAGVRLNGTVTGPAPGGVTVSIQPTSLVDESALGTKDVTHGMANAAYVVPAGDDGAGKVPEAALPYTDPAVRSPVVSTQSAADGSWFLAGIKAPGYYLVTFAKTGFQTEKFVISPQSGQQIPPLMVPMVPGSGQLSGRVVDGSDKGVGGALVSITDGQHTVTTTTPTRGDVGHWEVDGLSTPGSYLVSASASGFGTSSTSVQLDPPPSGSSTSAETVNLTLPTGTTTVSGFIYAPDADGNSEPLGGATVTLTEGTFRRSATTATTAAERGLYVIPDVPIPGTYTLTVTGPGVVPRSQTITLGSGSASTQPTTSLTSSTGSVTGTISDTSGNPVAGVGVTLTGDGGTYKVLAGQVGTSTAQTYRITGVTPGSYVATATVFGYNSQSLPVTVTGGATTTQNFTLTAVPSGGLPETATITGSAIDARTGARISACDSDIATPAQCLLTAGTSEERDGAVTSFSDTVPAAEGYTLPDPASANPETPDSNGLLPGLHAVTLNVPGYEQGSTSVLVPLGQNAQAPTVALNPTAIITGTVSTLIGQLPPDTCVTAEAAASAGAGAACTVSGGTCTTGKGAVCTVPASTGAYTIKDLIHGSYNVRVITPPSSPYLPVAAASLTLGVSETQTYDPVVHRLAQVEVDVSEPSATGVLGPPASASVTLTCDTCPGGSATPTPTGSPAPTSYTGTTDKTTGVVVFDAVTPASAGSSTFTITGTDTSTPGAAKPATATFSGLPVTLDQYVKEPLVLTSAVGTSSTVATGHVTKSIDNVPADVSCAEVTVTGTTGYSGTTPIVQSVTLGTTSTGTFTLVPTGTALPTPANTGCPPFAGETDPAVPGPLPSSAVLDLVVPQVQIHVAGDSSPTGYGALDLTATAAGPSAITIPVVPTPVNVAGAGFLDPQAPVSGGTPTVQVVSAPPGAGSVTVAVVANSAGGAEYALQFQDSALAQNVVVPGTYVLRASFTGYDALQESVKVLAGANAGDPPLISVNGGAAASSFTLTITEQTALQIQATCSRTLPSGPCKTAGALLTGVTATVTSLNADGTRATVATLSAAPGATQVQTPNLPVTDITGAVIKYSADVRVAGFAFLSAPVALTSASGSPGTPALTTVSMTPRGSISGVLTGQAASGLPRTALGGVSVSAVRVGEPNGNGLCPSLSTTPVSGTSFPTATGPDGSFTITGTTTVDGLVDGCYDLTVGSGTTPGGSPTGYSALPDASYVVDVESGDAAGGQETFTKTFTATTVGLTFTVSYGSASVATQPANLKLVLNPAATVPAPVFTKSSTGVAATDVYTFTGLVPQVYAVTVTADGFSNVSTSVSLTAGSSDNTASVTLASNVDTVAGTVTLQPIAGVTVKSGQAVTVTATNTGTSKVYATTGGTLTSTADNTLQFSYIIGGLPDGNYNLTATSSGSTTNTVDFNGSTISVPLSGGTTSTANLALSEATTSVPVTITSTAVDGTDASNTLDGTIVTLTPVTGPVAGSVQNYVLAARSASGKAAATVTFTQIPSGTYTLSAAGVNGHLSSNTVNVTAPANTTGASSTPTLATQNLTITEARVVTTVAVTSSNDATPPVVTVQLFDGDPAASPAPSSVGSAASATATSSNGFTTATVVTFADPGSCATGKSNIASYYAKATSGGYSAASVKVTASACASATSTPPYSGTASLAIQQTTGLTVTVTRGNDLAGIGNEEVDAIDSGNNKTTGTTDSTGSFTFTGLKAGSYTVVVPDGHAGTAADPYGFTTTTGGVTLAAGASVIVRAQLPAVAPGTPQNVAATGGVNTASVTWTAATSDGGGTITGYRAALYAATAGGAATGSPVAGPQGFAVSDTFSYSQNNLAPGSYVFEVTTVAGPLSSAAADSTAVTVTGLTVAGVTATVSDSSATPAVPTVKVDWTTSAGLTYQLVDSANSGTRITPTAAGTYTFTYPSATTEESHTYTVYALVGTVQLGSGSTGSTTLKIPPAAMAAPTLAQDSPVVDGQLKVTWTAPGARGSTISGYVITVTPDGGSPISPTTTVTGGTTTSYDVSGLTDGTGYTVTIHATSNHGNGGESASSNDVKPSAPAPAATPTPTPTPTTKP